MALPSNNVAVAVVKQPTADTFVDPTTANVLAVSQLRFQIDGITVANDEYTGSPFKNADAVTGKRITGSFNIKLRPPGGSTPPSADAYLPGLFLQAAKFTEVIVGTAVPSSPEAGSSGTTTAVTLGAGATGTAGLYKGKAISLASMGSDYRSRMTAITAYTAGKVATLAETFGSSVSGNYQIPKQLQYVWTPDATDPTLLSLKIWLAGDRIDLMNVRVSGFQEVVPTSDKNQGAYPEFQINFTADISNQATEAVPAIPTGGIIPFFKNADCWLNRTALGFSTFTLDMGLTVEYPPNPNKADGSDAGQLVAGVAKLTGTRQRYLRSVIDPIALADAQSYIPFWAQWGNAAGAMVQLVITDARINYANPDLSGQFMTDSVELLIDPGTSVISINFPY